MFLQSIAHATPPLRLTQSECWQILQDAPILNQLSDRSVTMLEKILLGDTGIAHRHFATEAVENLFSLDAQALNQNFETRAPALAQKALVKALAKAELNIADLDALLICTCTGYLCPGISSYVSEKLGLRPDAFLQDQVGLGCGAAIPLIRSAANLLARQPNAKIATIAVELCSSAFYLDNDPGVLISACLFGDAAAAAIWSQNDQATGYRAQNFDTLHIPEDREHIRFINRGGKLCNQLHRCVPDKAAQAVAKLYQNAPTNQTTTIANHTGGRDVIDALNNVLPQSLNASRQTLLQYGNTSSPSVLITLEQILNQSTPEHIWLTSFGAGFAAHACSLTQK